MNLRMRLIVGDRVLIAVAFVAIAATANIEGRLLVNIYCALGQFGVLSQSLLSEIW